MKELKEKVKKIKKSRLLSGSISKSILEVYKNEWKNVSININIKPNNSLYNALGIPTFTGLNGECSFYNSSSISPKRMVRKLNIPISFLSQVNSKVNDDMIEKDISESIYRFIHQQLFRRITSECENIKVDEYNNWDLFRLKNKISIHTEETESNYYIPNYLYLSSSMDTVILRTTQIDDEKVINFISQDGKICGMKHISSISTPKSKIIFGDFNKVSLFIWDDLRIDKVKKIDTNTLNVEFSIGVNYRIEDKEAFSYLEKNDK